MKEAREILFRGRHKGEWIQGMPSEVHGVISQIVSNGTNDSCAGWFYQVEEETVSQYIGYTDKAEKKIFVGDIVKAYDSEFRMTFIGEVVYHHGSFCIKEPQDKDLFHFRWEDYYGEVIGNIWDNPELLEGPKNGQDQDL